MKLKSVPTEIFHPGDNLIDFIAQAVGELREREVLVVTSKIVSLAEGRLVATEQISKSDLVKKEADIYLCEGAHNTHLTIKHGLFVAAAGIDESNSENGDYILYPERPYESAKGIWQGLRKHFGLRELGVILSDSHTSPLRRGVTGIALSHWGFAGVNDRIGAPDLFGRTMKMTQINVADSLAVAAVLLMGETNESRPLAVIADAPVQFHEGDEGGTMEVKPYQDLYSPLFKPFLPKP